MLGIKLNERSAPLNFEEAIEFYSKYLSDATTTGIPRDNIDVNQTNRGLSGVVVRTINHEQCD